VAAHSRKVQDAGAAAACQVSLCHPKSRDLKSPTVAPGVPWLPSLTSLAFGLPLLLLYWQLGSPSALLSDPNTGVHVRTGEWILVHHGVPREDLFSFSIQGQAWCDWEWLSNFIYALLYRWNGLAAIVTVSLAVLCLMSAMIYRTACLHARPAVAFAVTSMVVAVTTVHWLARPHLFSWVLLGVFCWVVERSRTTGRRGYLLVLPVLMLLWVNLHPGFVVGFGLLAVWLVAAVVKCNKSLMGQNEGDEKKAREWACWFGLIGLGCLAATLVNPYGIELHRHILWYLFSPSSVTTHVTEWLSPDFHNPRLYWFELLLPLCAAAGLWNAWRRRFAWCVLSLAGIHLALAAVRNVPICAILCAAPVASLIDELVGQYSFMIPFDTTGRPTSPQRAGVAICFGIASLLVLGGYWSKPMPLAPESSMPVAAVTHLPPGRLFTSDSWADYVIYTSSGRKVFFDCRNDVYGGDFVQAYLRVMKAEPGWQEVLMKYRIAVALVPRTSAISAALASSVEWNLSYADETAAVFERSET
jgi:hypothetical protein